GPFRFTFELSLPEIPAPVEGTPVRLSTKFILAMLLVLLLAFGLTAWLLIHHERDEIEQEAEKRARAIVSFGEACRADAANTLAPAVKPERKRFVFEAESATFVARGTFDELRKNLPEYSFREASLNPLNPANRASPAEAELIRRFQEDPSLKELSGFTHQ